MTIRIEHTVQVWREDGSHVARATPLDVMSCGMTPEEARRNLSEAVALFFKTASARGTLADVLEECGYRRVNDEWRAPILLSSETVSQAISA
jgi:predicted RNase H-like HicB family nuclease